MNKIIFYIESNLLSPLNWSHILVPFLPWHTLDKWYLDHPRVAVYQNIPVLCTTHLPGWIPCPPWSLCRCCRWSTHCATPGSQTQQTWCCPVRPCLKQTCWWCQFKINSLHDCPAMFVFTDFYVQPWPWVQIIHASDRY